MTSVAPRPQKISDVKSKLLNPALTSHFMIYIGLPKKEQQFKQFMAQNSLVLDQDRLHLLCCETSLPGSSLATTELKDDFSGVTERHAYRRIYQDRIDLTFYCDADQYMPIRFFESWLKFIMNEGTGIESENYSYKVKYPEDYKGTLEITKFEKNLQQNKSVIPLTYKFVNIFPVAITSIPVSYEASSLLKCSVSMNYTRYFISPSEDSNSFADGINLDLNTYFPRYDGGSDLNPFDPEGQATFNDTLGPASAAFGGTGRRFPDGSILGSSRPVLPGSRRNAVKALEQQRQFSGQFAAGDR